MALPKKMRQAFVLTFFAGCILSYGLTQYFTRPIHPELDVSMLPINTAARKVKGKVWLINYVSCGQFTGHSQIKNRNFLNFSAIGRGVDATINYGKDDLDPAFCARNADLLKIKKGGGYWVWKPYVIYKTLCMVPEGDVVVYMDAGTAIVKDITPLVNLLENRDVILFQSTPGQTMGAIKRDALYVMGMDDEKYLKKTQITSSVLVIKNTSYARQFIKMWLDGRQHPYVGTPPPSKLMPEYTNFQGWHTDQSVLTLCYLKAQTDPAFQKNPRIFVYPRSRVCLWHGWIDRIIARPRKWKPNRGYEHKNLAGKLAYDYLLHHRRREDTLTLSTRFLKALRHPYVKKPADPSIKEGSLNDTNGLKPGQPEPLTNVEPWVSGPGRAAVGASW